MCLFPTEKKKFRGHRRCPNAEKEEENLVKAWRKCSPGICRHRWTRSRQRRRRPPTADSTWPGATIGTRPRPAAASSSPPSSCAPSIIISPNPTSSQQKRNLPLYVRNKLGLSSNTSNNKTRKGVSSFFTYRFVSACVCVWFTRQQVSD